MKTTVPVVMMTGSFVLALLAALLTDGCRADDFGEAACGEGRGERCGFLMRTLQGKACMVCFLNIHARRDDSFFFSYACFAYGCAPYFQKGIILGAKQNMTAGECNTNDIGEFLGLGDSEYLWHDFPQNRVSVSSINQC
jgi:hypothetical protein